MQKLKYTHPSGVILEYALWGDGPETLFAFHGYGRSLHDFEGLTHLGGISQRVVAINLPFHGNSFVPRKKFAYALYPSVLLDFIASLNVQKYNLAGYSLGGRVVLHLLQLRPHSIGRIRLISPDGIGFNPWYYFASQTRIGRWIHRRLFYNSTLIMRLLNFAQSTKLSSARLHKFALNNYSTRVQRFTVYRIWEAHRLFSPSINKVKKIVINNKIPIEIFIGKYERIIPRKPIERFARQLRPYVILKEIDAGHLPDFAQLWILLNESS